MMKTRIIAINGITDLSTFVSEASKVEGDVYLTRGRYTVDAKSLLGVMSINIAAGAAIEYPESANAFDEYIAQFETNI